MRLGSGNNGEFTFLDWIAILSFEIGLQNLDMNIDQSDIDQATQELDKKLHKQVDDIHSHLTVQDAKLNLILSILEDIKNDSKRDIH